MMARTLRAIIRARIHARTKCASRNARVAKRATRNARVRRKASLTHTLCARHAMRVWRCVSPPHPQSGRQDREVGEVGVRCDGFGMKSLRSETAGRITFAGKCQGFRMTSFRLIRTELLSWSIRTIRKVVIRIGAFSGSEPIRWIDCACTIRTVRIGGTERVGTMTEKVTKEATNGSSVESVAVVDRTEAMVTALLPLVNATVAASLVSASQRFRLAVSNLSPNLATAILAARNGGTATARYDGGSIGAFGSNRNRNGAVICEAAVPFEGLNPRGKDWFSRAANIGQDFPNGLKGTIESAFLDYLTAWLTGESNGDLFRSVRAILETAAAEDRAIREAFLTAIRTTPNR